MKVPIWVHHFATGYPGLVGWDDGAQPFSEVYGKTNDGLRWQSTWDAGVGTAPDGKPWAVRSLGNVAEIDTTLYGPQDLEYKPWGVVHGRWENGPADYAGAEGKLAAQIALAAAPAGETPVYIVDLEPHYHAPFPTFWRDDLGAGPTEVERFGVAFQLNGGGELWIAPDARDPHLEPVSFEEWARGATRVLPQVYFTDFRMHSREALERALDRLHARGGVQEGDVYPILPGNADPDEMVTAIEVAQILGCGGVSVWQRANLWPETAEAIAAMDDPWAQPPSVEREALKHVEVIEQETAALRRMLEGVG